MKKDRSPSGATSEIVRRMMSRGDGSRGQINTGDELQRACTRVYDTLRDSLGEDGSSALLARALALTEGAHPSLKTLRDANGRGITLAGIAASVEKDGIEPVTVAIEAMLAALVEVLSRLIGEDMAGRLFDQNGQRPQKGDGARAQ